MNARHLIRILAVPVALALLAVPLAAQPGGPGGGPGWAAGEGGHGAWGRHGGRGGERHGFLSQRLIRFLDLTEEQVASAQQLRDDLQAANEPLREAMRTNHEELRTLLDGGNADATQVGELVIDSHDLRGQLHDARQGAFEDFKALLTPEQLERLEAFLDSRPHRRGGRGGGDGAGG